MKSDVVLPIDISATVAQALKEDIGMGDITSVLIPPDAVANANVVVRESAIVCGAPWFNEVYYKIDDSISIEWLVNDGDAVSSNDVVCNIHGKASSLLSGERTALNFLQTLSGTATTTHEYVEKISGTGVKILDTRKTVPGLRNAQKYAVRTGGGNNHRFGLYDGVLIKENHLLATDSLDEMIKKLPAERKNGLLIEVEVENLKELEVAIDSGANRIMLDNFSIRDIEKAVQLTNQKIELEASGNYDLNNVREVAEAGVDYISVGALTKNLRAIDYSMRFVKQA